jgi:hypothetical protein
MSMSTRPTSESSAKVTMTGHARPQMVPVFSISAARRAGSAGTAHASDEGSTSTCRTGGAMLAAGARHCEPGGHSSALNVAQPGF